MRILYIERSLYRRWSAQVQYHTFFFWWNEICAAKMILIIFVNEVIWFCTTQALLQWHVQHVNAYNCIHWYRISLFFISEEPPLYFSREPECGSAVAERGVKILTCQSYSNPAPAYRWLREGTYVSQESLSGTFKMYSINRTEAGSYRCQATNSLGSIISDSCRVNVACMCFICH